MSNPLSVSRRVRGEDEHPGEAADLARDAGALETLVRRSGGHLQGPA